uniref:Uncharacterized protein n=1 Tax=Clytia hemisphaerica TaxID=252671 RepID=A0A7M5VFR9_9CNID
MDGKQLHGLVWKITAELQPLCSLLVEAFASYHNNDLAATPSQAFAKRMKDTYNGQKKKIYSLATNKFFDNNNPKKDNLRKDIGFNNLDIQVLLKLLIETDFLFERDKGTCGVHHSAKCCNSCKHKMKRCPLCNCDKADCGKLCCKLCGKCVKCSRDKFEDFKEFYLSGKDKNCDIITMENSNLCYMANLKASLEVMLKWRNLFHVTREECEHFVCNRSKSLGNNFKDINGGQDELFKIIHMAIKTVIKLLSDPNYFDGKVDFRKQVKEIENDFDEIIDSDSKF